MKHRWYYWQKQSWLFTPSLKLHNQFGFRACEKIFTNRAVLLLFKYNLLLLRYELSVLLSLLMNLIPLHLPKFSNFLLIFLIFSSKSWLSRWMTLEKAICISLSTSISLIVVMTFLTFWSVLTLFWPSLVPVWMMTYATFSFIYVLCNIFQIFLFLVYISVNCAI